MNISVQRVISNGDSRMSEGEPVRLRGREISVLLPHHVLWGEDGSVVWKASGQSKRA